MPIDETRYAAVAWEMWNRGDFLVPYLNGEVYSHKPPLLFWLMQLSWRLFGVNDWSLRIISPLFSLATLLLTIPVAEALWPGRKRIADAVPFILLGSCFWIVYGTLTMFDVMLSFFVLLGVFCLVGQDRSGVSLKRWLLMGAAIGGGALTKGPVILLHLLPLALSAPWWALNRNRICWRSWYAGMLFSVCIGFIIALSWAVPAGIRGGETYRNAIFFGQTGGRLVNSFAHRFPWWWYLKTLPVFLLPWLLVKPFWSGAGSLSIRDAGVRFCTAWLVPIIIAFSLISGKRIHYLLPLLPGLALLLAKTADQAKDAFAWRRAHLPACLLYALAGLALAFLPMLAGHVRLPVDLSRLSPVWGAALFISASALCLVKAADAGESILLTCLATVIALLTASDGFFYTKSRNYDTGDAARYISSLISNHKAVAYAGGKYHGQYHFSGRLTGPIKVLGNAEEITRWSKNHPDGCVIVAYKNLGVSPDSLFSYHAPYKGHHMGVISAQVLLDNPKLVHALKW